MAITGKIKTEGTGSSYTKSYGLAAYEILGVNLSNKELKELGFYVKDEELDQDREFVKERDGVATVMLEFVAKSVGSNSKLRKFAFYLENKNARNSEEKERALYKFINDQGKTAWSTTPATYTALSPQYAHYFTGADDDFNPRPAKRGEEEFMLFMRNCMAINYKEGGTISYNVKKLFNGNFKELQADLETDFLSTILVATTIKVKETEDGIKEYESFYPYAFAPGSYYKAVASKGEFTQNDINAIHEKIANNKAKVGKKQWVTPLEELIAKMTDENYPCKDIYHLGVVKDFASTEHVETAKSAIISEEDDDDDDSSKY